jgi:hypothetical protein
MDTVTNAGKRDKSRKNFLKIYESKSHFQNQFLRFSFIFQQNLKITMGPDDLWLKFDFGFGYGHVRETLSGLAWALDNSRNGPRATKGKFGINGKEGT